MSIPKVESPDEVEEIVFQCGLNNIRKNELSPEQIQDKILDMQVAYNDAFPNARQHVVGLPPLNDEYIKTNKLLEKQCKFTGSNYVSTKAFLDKKTKRPRSDCFEDSPYEYHYEGKIGVPTLAKAIKKSLYSDANIDNDRLSTISHYRKKYPDTSDHTH